MAKNLPGIKRFWDRRDRAIPGANSIERQGVDCIALACTDMQLLKPEKDRSDIPIFDTMSILAEAALEEIISGKSAKNDKIIAGEDYVCEEGEHDGH